MVCDVNQHYLKYPTFDLPHGFQYPNLPKYEGKANPLEFVSEFLGLTRTYQKNLGSCVHLLRTSLEGEGKAWMNTLSWDKLHGFNGIVHKFIDHFKTQAKYTPTWIDLTNLKIKVGEEFISFIDR